MQVSIERSKIVRDYRRNLKMASRELRGNMTDAELLLWLRL